MSGHWRFCVAALLLFTGLTTSSAFSNPLTDLFDPAPKEAAAPAVAKEEVCARQPGSSTAPGQHWFYRIDGHRKCWFQAAEATHSANKPVHHFAVRRPVIAAEENQLALRKRTVMDAQDQLLSAAPAPEVRPTAPAPEVIDKPSVPADEAATPAPAAPAAAQPAIDRTAPEQATPRSVDVEALLAASSLDAAASSAPAAPAGAPSIPDADHPQSMATRAGAVLIALGLVFLVATLLARRLLYPGLAPIRRA